MIGWLSGECSCSWRWPHSSASRSRPPTCRRPPRRPSACPRRGWRVSIGAPSQIGAGKLPGIVVAIARRGKVVYQKAFGVANLQTREPMRAGRHVPPVFDDEADRQRRPADPLRAGEVPPHGSAGPLPAPVRECARSTKARMRAASRSSRAPSRKPTIQDAFRHTLGLASGLGQSPGRRPVSRRRDQHGPAGLASAGDGQARNVPLLYDPGERWVYGLGHDVQARLIEVFSGMSLRRVPAADHLRPPRHARHGVRRTGEVEGALPGSSIQRVRTARSAPDTADSVRAIHRSSLRDAEPVGHGVRLPAILRRCC